MKPVLSLAYVVDSTSLGTISIENAIALGNVTTAQTLSSPTVSQQLIAALGKIRLTGAVFSTLNMGAPLIRSLNLDLLFRDHKPLFDEFNVLSATSFNLNKFLEDVPELSDIAGKFLAKSGTIDLVEVLDEVKATKTQFRIFDEAVGASVQPRAFYIGKRVESTLTFGESFTYIWRPNLFFREEPLLTDTASLLYEKSTVDSNVSTFVFSQLIRPKSVEDILNLNSEERKDLNLKFTNFLTPSSFNNHLYLGISNYTNTIVIGTGPITERDTELATIDSARWDGNDFPGTGIAFNIGKRLNNVIELEELPELYRVVSAFENVDLEEVSKKLTKINISVFKRPFQQIHDGTLTNFVTSSVSSNSPNHHSGDGPFTERDTELAAIESDRWHNNEFPNIGIAFSAGKRLSNVIELDELPELYRVVYSLDITDFEEVAAKKIEASFITPRSLNSLTGRDTELATIQSDRWHNNEFPNIGIAFSTGKRLNDQIKFKHLVFPVKVKALNETILSEDSKKMFQTLEFLSNRSIETERDGELLSLYAGRDGMAFQLPLRIDVEQLSVKTNYVLPTKIVSRASLAFTEENIEDLSVYKNLLNKAELEDKAGKAVAKNKLLDNISTNVEVLPVKVIPVDRELFSVAESIEDKLILKNILHLNNVVTSTNSGGEPTSYRQDYSPFRVELEDTSVLESIKRFIESTSLTSIPEAHRQIFSFDELNIADTSKKEVQKVVTEDPLLLDILYRQVEYKRDYQSENALADDTLSGFSQNYSSGYFSQAYVGIEITGD